jgi:hypothetical protein
MNCPACNGHCANGRRCSMYPDDRTRRRLDAWIGLGCVLLPWVVFALIALAMRGGA